MYRAGARIRKDLDLRELFQVGAKDVALQDEIGELALADDLDQTGCFQLFYVMGECRGAYTVEFVQLSARRSSAARADFFEDLDASRLSQSAGDPRKLAIGKPGAVGVCHSSQGSLIGFECPMPYFSARSTHPAPNERLSSRCRRLAMPGRSSGVWLMVKR